MYIRIGAVAAVGVGLLAACPSGGPEPEPEPSPIVCEVGGPERLLHDTAGNSATPVLVDVDGQLLAVWEENDGLDSGEVVALPLDGDGVAVGASVVVAELDAWGAQPQAVATSSGEVAVVWVQGTDPCGPIGARIVGPDGVGRTDPMLVAASEAWACIPPAVTWVDDHALVVWVHEPGEDQTDLWAATWAPTSGWGEASKLTDSGGAGTPTLLWTGDDAVLLWMDVGDGVPGARVARLGADGALEAGPATLFDDLTPRYLEPALAGEQPVVVWDTRADRDDAWLQLAELDGTTLAEPVPFSDGTDGSVNDVSHVVGGDLLATAWSDDRGNRIYASVSDAAGRRASADLQLSEATAGFGLQPAVGRTADGFVVVWRDTRDHPGGDLYTRTITCGER